MTDPAKSQPIPQGPYAAAWGLSYVTFGELLHAAREHGPGRYPVEAYGNERFHLVLYDDKSWRISTPQLWLWPEFKKLEEPHTLT